MNLTNHPADDGGDTGGAGGPSWSPDGRNIVFDSRRTGTLEVFSMTASGADVSQLTDGGTNIEPAWSPDGQLIAFASDRNGSRDLFLMASDGTSESPLATIPAFDERPDWQVIPGSGPDDDNGGPQPGDYRNAAQFCKADRDFLGERQFRQRYGTGPRGANAYGKCVASNGGR